MNDSAIQSNNRGRINSTVLSVCSDRYITPSNLLDRSRFDSTSHARWKRPEKDDR